MYLLKSTSRGTVTGSDSHVAINPLTPCLPTVHNRACWQYTVSYQVIDKRLAQRECAVSTFSAPVPVKDVMVESLSVPTHRMLQKIREAAQEAVTVNPNGPQLLCPPAYLPPSPSVCLIDRMRHHYTTDPTGLPPLCCTRWDRELSMGFGPGGGMEDWISTYCFYQIRRAILLIWLKMSHMLKGKCKTRLFHQHTVCLWCGRLSKQTFCTCCTQTSSSFPVTGL